MEYKWISGYTYSFTAYLLSDSTVSSPRNAVQLFDCASYPSLTSAGVINVGKVKISKYTGLTTTASGPGLCHAYIEENSRVQYIRNISQSYQQALHIYTMLSINVFMGPNSSPKIINPPVFFIDNPNTITYNPNAFDSDGDSLSYSLIKCNGTTLPGFWHTLYPNTTIDNSGTVTIPKDSAGLFAFCIQIVEWRKDFDGIWQSISSSNIDFVVDIVSSVGINKLTKKEIISIYPNPTSNTLNIKTNSKTNSEIEIFNSLGQMVLKQKYSESVDVSKLVPGYYFIRINNSYSKFIKE